ncbi:DUF6249 domain-containing protein [Thalassotalea ponticola]|uniref:DUF6249 domain-containing protein n=1 Tax=Thalassotalea ponticola TaxID=1523392 RepID=UPI0025B6002B|nr:DUF6249 domain-containing protein [Thalassotalea ponticola]MDN3651915.1 DUF6249 domain-containing protein [Thalassotalea ponticola]
MASDLVPIALFATVGVVIWLIVFYNHKNKAVFQQTIQKALDKGEGISPSSVEQLLQMQQNPQSDFKRGILLVCASIGIALYSYIGDVDRDIAAIAMFPLAIGIGYLLLAKMANKGQ